MKKKLSALASVAMVSATLAALAAAPAQAQDSATNSPPATSPPVEHRAFSTAGGNGLGVGAAAFLSGVAGPEVVFDFPAWHIEGLLGFDSRTGGGANPPRLTTVDFGVSAWWHAHTGASSDLSLGGGIGFVSLSGGGGSGSAFVLEPGALARAFLTPNVAAFARMGLAFDFGDNVGGVASHIGLGGQLMGGFGFTYFLK